jgi:WD40 repeat protein
LAVTLTIALFAVAGLATYGIQTRRVAEHARDLALSRQLAEAANRLRVVDPTVAAQLALLGYRTAPTVEARSALLDTTAIPLARRLEGPGGPVAVASSGNGRILAAAGDQGGLRLWTVRADGLPALAAAIHHVQGPPLYAVAVDQPGRLVAAAGGGGVVHLWDTNNPKAPRQLQPLKLGDSDTVLALTFRSDGGSLAAAVSGPDGGRVRVWDVTRSHIAAGVGITLDPDESTVQAVSYSADGDVLATAGASGRITRWAMTDEQPRALPPLTGATGTMTSLAFSPDGQTLTAGSKDQNLYLWRLQDPKALAASPPVGEASAGPTVVPGAQSWVNVVAVSPDGGQLIAGSSDSHLRVYDAATLTPLADIGQPGPVTGGVYSSDGATLITGDADGRLRIWPLPLPQGGLPKGRTFGLAYLGTDRLLALTARNTTRIFDVTKPFAARPTTGTFGAPANSQGTTFAGTLAVSRDGRLFASGGTDGTTWLYQVADTQRDKPPTPTATLPKTQSSLIQAAAFTADGRTLVTSEDNATLQITDVTDPHQPRTTGPPTATVGTVYALASSPDGRIMASGTGTAGTIQLWDTTRPGQLHLLGQAPSAGSPTLQVYGLAFSPDSRTLVIGAADRSIRFLDVSDAATPRWVGNPIHGAGDYIFSVQFSPDGKALASASGDGVIRLYNLSDSTTATPLAALTAPGRVGMYSVAFDPTGRRLAAGGATEAVYIWNLDPELAARRVCSLVGDAIPVQEWQRYVPSVPFTPPCGRSTR